MFVNIFLASSSPYDIQNYVWEFLVPPNKGLFVICDTNSTQNLHRALQEDVWFARVAENLEGVHFPPHLFATQHNPISSLRNLKTQHVKHTSNLNATLHTFPHCNQHIWVSFCRAGKIAVSCHFFSLRRAFVWPNHTK